MTQNTGKKKELVKLNMMQNTGKKKESVKLNMTKLIENPFCKKELFTIRSIGVN